MITAWMHPSVLLVISAIVAGAPDYGATGVGAWGIGTDGDEISSSESMSILSYFK